VRYVPGTVFADKASSIRANLTPISCSGPTRSSTCRGLLEELRGSCVKGPHVPVQRLHWLKRTFLSLVVAPDRRDEAFRDRAARDPRFSDASQTKS
jgi:hypothetical protein